MRLFLILAILAASLTTAHARPDTRSMTCRQAAALIARHGAVVVSTGRHSYERLVSGPRFCLRGQIVEEFPVPTRDRRYCRAGYRCTEYTPRFRSDD